MPWDFFRAAQTWLLCACLGLSALPAAAQSQPWFPPTTSWLALRLKEAGCQTVRHDGKAVGGLLEGSEPGPRVVFTSDDPAAAIRVLKAMGLPTRGSILAVFGSGVKLQSGDYLLKVESTPDLRDGQLALSNHGPSVDRFELVIDEGSSTMPDIALASDLVLCLQNRANTANELVSVKVGEFRDLPGGQIAVDLTLRVFNPDLRERASAALEQISRERLESQGAALQSIHREPSPRSGQWSALRKAMGSQVDILQADTVLSPLSNEDFGRPKMPSITLRVGGFGPATTEALVGALKLMLRFPQKPTSPTPE